MQPCRFVRIRPLLTLGAAILSFGAVTRTEAGSITGTVTSADQAVAGVRVEAYLAHNPWTPVHVVETAGNGTYSLADLEPGSYLVRFDGRQVGTYASWYGDVPFVVLATEVSVGAGATTGINADLERSVLVQGRVSDPEGGGISGVLVRVIKPMGWGWEVEVGTAETDANGDYAIGGLGGGSYALEAIGIRSLWGASRLGGGLQVVNGEHRDGVDLTLEPAGAISGTVRNAEGDGIRGVAVSLYHPNLDITVETTSLDDGSYFAGALDQGEWRVTFQGAAVGYSFQYYNGVQDALLATMIPVTPGSEVTGIEATLQRQNAISGRVTNGYGIGIPGVTVEVYEAAGEWPYSTGSTGDDGRYVVSGIGSGDFHVHMIDPSGRYLSQWYNNTSERAGAQPVAVVEGQHTAGVDVVLAEGSQGSTLWGRVSGTDGNYLLGAYLSLSGAASAWGETDADGWYLFTGLPSSDDYELWAEPPWPSPYGQQSVSGIALAVGEAQRVDVTLPRLGSIRGRIVNEEGAPIDTVQVSVYDASSENWWAGWASPDENGYFEVFQLAAGEYKLQADEWTGAYRWQWYDRVTSFEDATVIEVQDGLPTDIGDVTMAAGAGILGRVTDAVTGLPIGGVWVYHFDAQDYQSWGVTTAADGTYRLSNLDPGNYKILFSAGSAGYYNQYYNNKENRPDADWVTFGGTDDVTGIDAALVPGARITGTVTDMAGQPLSGVMVNVHTEYNSWNPTRTVNTNAQGEYTATLVPTQEQRYKVKFSKAGYVGIWYDGVADFSSATMVPGNPIPVGSSMEVSGIDGQLRVAGSVSGTVVENLSGSPLVSVRVVIYPQGSYSQFAEVYTNAQGAYQIDTLPTGNYQLYYYGSSNHQPIWYGGVTDQASSQVVAVVEGTHQNLGETRKLRYATVSGTVTDLPDANPVESVQVSLHLGGSVNASAWAYTDSTGAYTFSSVVPADDYRVRFMRTGYATQWYELKPSQEIADPIVVGEGQTVTEIDASLSQRGAIAGTVSDSLGGAVMQGVTVDLLANGGQVLASQTTNFSGYYIFQNLEAATYKVRFSRAGFLTQWYNNRDSEAEADAIVVSGTGTQTAHAAMVNTGRIAGTVTGADTGTALSGIMVYAYTEAGSYVSSATTSSMGTYAVGGLNPGLYRLRFVPAASGAYLPEWYDQKADHASADSVSMPEAGAVTYGIDAALTRGATLQGTIRDGDSSQPIPYASVSLYGVVNGSETYLRGVTANASGSYTIPAVPAGDYRLRVTSSGYLDGESDVLTLVPPETRQLNLNLYLGAVISGTVTDATTEDPVQDVMVSLYGSSGIIANRFTDAAGAYSFVGVRTGTYTVRFAKTGTFTQWYAGVDDQADATPVVVTAPNPVTGIDAALLRPGAIAGTVTDTGAEPVANVLVNVYRADDGSAAIGSAYTASDGAWQVTGLRTGNYKVEFAATAPYLPQWYSGAADFAGANPVAVTAPQVTGSVDAQLASGASLSGTISGLSSDDQIITIEGAWVYLYAAANPQSVLTSTVTGSTGDYAFSGLVAGDYLVTATATAHAQRWHGGVSADDAEVVTMTPPDAVTGIDILLPRTTSVYGRIVDSRTAEPVAGVMVALHRDGYATQNRATAEDGVFTFADLDTGTYKVSYNGTWVGYFEKYHDGKPDHASADPIHVVAPYPVDLGDVAVVEGGKISGTITGINADGEVTPLFGVAVRIARADARQTIIRTTSTNASGQYLFQPLESGDVVVSAAASGYLVRWFGASTAADADVVAVTEPETTAGVDIQVPRPATLAGRVVDAADAVPVQGAWVRLYNAADQIVTTDQTQEDGSFSFASLESGDYRIGVDGANQGFLPYFHDNKESLAAADPITLVAPSATDLGDLALGQGGRIMGTVRNAAGEPIAGATVSVRTHPGGGFVRSSTTNDSGQYSVVALQDGSYQVTAGATGYLTAYYDGVPTAGLATGVAVADHAATTGIDFALPLPARVTGTVTDHHGDPVSGMSVQLLNASKQAIRFGATDPSGKYTFDDLWAGTYHVYFVGPNLGFLPQWHAGRVAVADADPIPLNPGDVYVANATMKRPGVVSGTVRSLESEFTSEQPIQGVTVTLHRADNNQQVTFTTTDTDGTYEMTSTALLEGDYIVRFYANLRGFYNQWYPLKHTLAEAEPITVPADGSVTGIDAWLVRPRITAEVAAGMGAFTPAAMEVDYGATAVFTLAPDPGWSPLRVADLLNPPWAVAPSSYTFTLTNVTQDRDLAVTFEAVADLVVTDIVAPAEAFNGEPILVSWTLTNHGSGVATGPWNDRVFLSDDPEPGNDQTLATFQFASSIPPGESVERTQMVTIPKSISEQAEYHLVVVTDFNNHVREGHAWEVGEQNNTTVAADPILVRISPGADLVVSAVDAPSSAFSGQETIVSWTITNIGNGGTDVTSWRDSVYLSLDDTLDGTDIYLGMVANVSFLPPGESYTSQMAVRLPNGISGNRHFIVRTDHYNHVTELDTTNNTGSAAFVVNLTPPPDLQVTSIGAPATAFSGQPVDVSWIVTNLGTGSSLATQWSDSVFLSLNDDPVITQGDVLLGHFSRSGVLAVGASYSQNRTVNIPAGVSGIYFFKVVADTWSQVFEHAYSENNVAAALAPTQIVLQGPDLEVTDVAVASGLPLRSGHPASFAWTVTNYGTATTPSAWWRDAVFLSTTSTFDPAAAIKLGEQGRYGAVGVGESYSMSASFMVPNGIEGQYHVFVVTDIREEVYELDAANNTSQPLAAMVELKPADLQMTHVSGPLSAVTSQAVLVTWTVSNNGLGPTPVATWTDRVYITADPTLQTGLTELGNFSHNGVLTVGAFYTRTETVVIPATLESGSYWIVAMTDTGSSVYELPENRDNNRGGYEVAVTRVAPDLTVAAVSGPPVSASGHEMMVDFTITNVGDGRTVRTSWNEEIVISPTPSMSDPGKVLLGRYQRTGELAAGESYSLSRGFTVPRSLSGTYYIGLTSDVWNQVADSDRTNNVRWSDAPVEITFTPAADLAVANMTLPATATSGQPMAVSWTVENLDADTDPGSTWDDRIFLSRDRIFDPSDIQLGWRDHRDGLQAGESYTKSGEFLIPLGISGPLYVFVVTDRQGRVFEDGRTANNVVYHPEPVMISLPSPSDLVVESATAPQSGTPGLPVQVQFEIRNIGINVAPAAWFDAVYISPVPVWSPQAIQLGRTSKSTALAPGAGYAATLTTDLPGVMPGEYHILVRTDVLNQVLESDEANNVGVSVGTMPVTVPALELGTPEDFALARDKSVYRRLTVPNAGDALLISLESPAAGSFNELYVGYERMPSRASFDHVFSRPFSASQDIVIPVTRAGTYYILAYGSTVTAGNNCALVAEIIPFSVRAVNPTSAGNIGKVTFEIEGARFTRDTGFALVHSSTGAQVAAERVYFRDTGRVFATFNLAGAMQGAYGIAAVDPSEAEDLLADALQVNAGQGARLEARIDGHQAVRPGREYVFQVNYANIGDTDAGPPLIVVRTSTDTPFGESLASLDTVPLQFLAGSPDGVGGILRPGESYGVPFYFSTSTATVYFTAQVVRPDDDRPIDWTSLEASVRPEGMDDVAWIDLWWRVRDRIGSTWGDYVRTLSDLATLIGWRGEDLFDVGVLWEELFAQAGGYPTARIGGTLVHGETGMVLPNVTLTVQMDRNPGSDDLDGLSIREAVTDDQGRFLFLNLDEGEHMIGAVGHILSDGGPYWVGAGEDVLGLVLQAMPPPPPVTLDAPPYDEWNPQLVVDSEGASHIVWLRGGDVWHARHDGFEWVDARPITAVADGDAGPIQALSIAASATLIDGADPGVAVTWQAGDGNDARVVRSIGRRVGGDGSYEWSKPESLTGSAQADRSPSMLITPDHRIMVVFQRQALPDPNDPAPVRDDPDLYYGFYNVVSGELEWLTPILPGAESLLLERPEDLGVEFTYELSASTGAVPGWIPLIGGKELKYKTSLAGAVSQGCSGLSGSLNASKEVSIFDMATAKFAGGGSIKYGTNSGQVECPDTRYIFAAATLHLSGSAEVFIPVFVYTIPGDGWLAKKYLDLKIGPKFGISISGMGGWSGGAFPGWPNTGEVNATISFGGQGEAEVLDGTAKGTVSLMGSSGYQLLPERKATGTSLTLAFDLEVGKHKQSYSKSWEWEPRKHGWWESGPTLARSPEGPLFEAFEGPEGESVQIIETDEGTITITTFPPFYSWGPTPGTTTDYRSVDIEPIDVLPVLGNAVETRILADGPPTVGHAAGTGIVRTAWARELPADAPKPGDEVVVATLNLITGTWNAPVVIPGSVGFVEDVGMIHHGDTPMVIWSAVDSTGMGASADIEDVLARMEERTLHYSRYVGGAWTAAAPLGGAGFNQRVTAGVAADGRVLAAWYHRPSSGADLQLLVSFWDGTAWTAPQSIHQGKLEGRPAIGRQGDGTLLFFEWNSANSDDEKRLRIGWHRHDADGWTAAAAFAPETFPVPEAAPAPAIASSFGFPPAYPASCCPPKKPKRPKPEPDPPPGQYPPPPYPGPYNPPVVRPMDPNDILGPEGYGVDRWIRSDTPIFYTIRFENDPEWATAPAQEVIITMQLDPDLDPRTFRVGGFGWADLRFDPAESRAFYSQRLDLRATHGYFVDVTAYVDVATGIATWRLLTIDPATLQKPLDGMVGFLLPNNEYGVGDGFVTFTVNPRRNLPSGTVIDAEATIVFDTEAPIDTPPIFNTLDTEPPTSTILPLPVYTEDVEFLVGWTGADDVSGSGLAHFDVFVAVDGGTFTPWLTATTLTEAPFLGQAGSRYGFYVLATDNTGQTEIKPEAEAEAEIICGVVPYTLTYLASAGGIVEGDTVQSVAPGFSGTDVLAVASQGYVFHRWSDGSTSNPRLDANVQANLEVVALFDIAASLGGVPTAWYRQYGLGPESGVLWSLEQWSALDAMDPDGDGATNLHEYIAGTNPVDRLSVLRIHAVTMDVENGTVTVTWPSVEGRFYRVEQSTDLHNWTPATGPIASDPPVNSQIIHLAPGDTRTYFRIRAGLAP